MTLKKWQKRVLWTLGSVFVLLSIPMIVGAIFMLTSPQFGAIPSAEDKDLFARSTQYNGEVFENLENTSLDISPMDIPKMLSEWMDDNTQTTPPFELPMEFPNPQNLGDSIFHFVWFGHSALWMSLEGKSILIDPMLTEVPAPHPWLGKSRFSSRIPIEIEDIPHVNYVLISHDHYDHLDYKTLLQLIPKTDRFLVPLGVGAHLKSWGIHDSSIVEFDWWEDFQDERINISFVPSRHFSGRGFADRNTTLWGGWTLHSQAVNLLFTGDGGYGNHFKEIGERLGPFDMAWIECGQYNPLWSQIHMMPEESVLAALDVRAKAMMPIHWGAFSLAPHAWDDPVLRVSRAAQKENMPLQIPILGEVIRLDSNSLKSPINPWWSPTPTTTPDDL